MLTLGKNGFRNGGGAKEVHTHGFPESDKSKEKRFSNEIVLIQALGRARLVVVWSHAFRAQAVCVNDLHVNLLFL